MNITKCLRSANGCFCTSNHKVSNKIWASLLNQNMTGKVSVRQVSIGAVV